MPHLMPGSVISIATAAGQVELEVLGDKERGVERLIDYETAWETVDDVFDALLGVYEGGQSRTPGPHCYPADVRLRCLAVEAKPQGRMARIRAKYAVPVWDATRVDSFTASPLAMADAVSSRLP